MYHLVFHTYLLFHNWFNTVNIELHKAVIGFMINMIILISVGHFLNRMLNVNIDRPNDLSICLYVL